MMDTEITIVPAPLAPWIDTLIGYYGDVIDEVILVGSRARACARPDSDWDLVLVLADDIYTDMAKARRIEAEISADVCWPGGRWPTIDGSPGVDLYIVRPDNPLIRWEDVPAESLSAPWVDGWILGLDGVPEMRVEESDPFPMVEGPLGDFSRFWHENRASAQIIWTRLKAAT